MLLHTAVFDDCLIVEKTYISPYEFELLAIVIKQQHDNSAWYHIFLWLCEKVEKVNISTWDFDYIAFLLATLWFNKVFKTSI